MITMVFFSHFSREVLQNFSIKIKRIYEDIQLVDKNILLWNIERMYKSSMDKNACVDFEK